jgi:anaerobic ribonucleoside-triphosphate reductase activating protein
VRELVWIIDPVTGDLTLEGLSMEEAEAAAADLLSRPRVLNCAQPIATTALPTSSDPSSPVLRVAALWHGSVVEGPGRRSVVQVQGCPLRCSRLCSVPETHSFDGGAVLPVDALVQALLDPIGEPRDGVSVIGGEPMAQPVGLAALLKRLKALRIHTVVYTGYSLEALSRRAMPSIRAALECTDLLIDGPYVAELADNAGEWRGSRNQRIIPNPAARLCQVHFPFGAA